MSVLLETKEGVIRKRGSLTKSDATIGRVFSLTRLTPLMEDAAPFLGLAQLWFSRRTLSDPSEMIRVFLCDKSIYIGVVVSTEKRSDLEAVATWKR